MVGLLNGYLETLEREVDAATVEACAERLVRLVDENEQIGSDIRRIMREDLGIPEAVSNTNGWSAEIASSLSELRWNRMQTVRTGIGQAVVTVTPIEVARYILSLIHICEGVEAFDIREGDEGKETRLVAIVKAKGKEEAQKAEEQLRAAAGKLGLTNVRFERSGSYVFAADGGFSEQMAEEFLRLTH